jgi:hypothetical protein
MGWVPAVLEDTLVKDLGKKPKFWEELAKLLKGEELDSSCFDSFGDTVDAETVRQDAFNYDHMEHMGSWVWDEAFWPLLKKHKANGSFVLWHEDGKGYLAGLKFVDGVPHEVSMELKAGKPRKRAGR